MRKVTALFILAAPFLVLMADAAVWRLYGVEATITGVVREWAEESPWPEVLFLVATVLLYVHLFRRWPT